MNFSKVTFSIVGVVLIIAGIIGAFVFVQSDAIDRFTGVNQNSNTIARGAADTIAPDRYLAFSMVAQEFWYKDQSIETIHRYIDLHEKYNVPIDIIVDDAVMQLYTEKAPDVLERLKSSAVVAVSYHSRPPTPFYKKFDFLGLADQSLEEIRETILRYEEHAIDLITGQTTDAPGGYQYVKDVIGYAPIMAGMITEQAFGETLLSIYKEKGASFIIEHRDEPIKLGQERSGLLIRPEDYPIIFTERIDDSPEQLIAVPLSSSPQNESVFMSIKTHDNDFFATESAWLSIYMNQRQRGTPQPPFDLSVHDQYASLLSPEEQEFRWKQYEALVAFASEHRDEYTLINAKALQSLVAVDNDQTSATQSTSGSGKTTLAVSVVTHNEEPASGRYPNFPQDESAFWQHRATVIDFARALHDKGVPYSWQSDWAFLKAVQEFDHGTADTNNKNIVRYLAEDLGVEVDAHAHQTIYNYADVSYLIEQLGVASSGVVGGFLASPIERSEYTELLQPIRSTLDSSYSWQAKVLWGGGSPLHTQDAEVSGVWRPKNAAEFTAHDSTATLPNVGTYTSDWDGVDDLLGKIQDGTLESGKLYTATVMINQDELLDESTVNSFLEHIDGLQDEAARGELTWLNIVSVFELWRDVYDEIPTVYQWQGSSTGATSTNNKPLTNTTQGGRGNCGNGMCEPLEARTGACSQDCS